MKSIILATDGSPSAAEATLRAIELAAALDATLVAVAVEHANVASYNYYGYADVVTELAKLEHEHVDEVLAQTKAAASRGRRPLRDRARRRGRSPRRSVLPPHSTRLA